MNENKFNFCVTWSLCCLGVSALISAYVTFAESLGTESDRDESHAALITSEKLVGISKGPVVVRVAEVSEESEERVDSFIYEHSVAPATPQLLPASSLQVYGSVHISSVSPSASTDVKGATSIHPEDGYQPAFEKNHDSNYQPVDDEMKNFDAFPIDAVDLMEYSSTDIPKENIDEKSNGELHGKTLDGISDSGFVLVPQDTADQGDVPKKEILASFDKGPITLSPTVPTPTHHERETHEEREENNIPEESTVFLDVTKGKEENSGKKSDKGMLSFTEWKQKLDEESKNQSEVEDIVNVSKLVSQKNKTILSKVNKIRKNYASLECGAKVVSSNAEASNSFAILKEDKDIYMLNPCNVKAWFVVELCERIELDSIDFANFEMFSSTPEEFAVYVSSRFPTREWEMTKVFTGKPEKKIHNYLFEERFYAKYLKIEVKKYFGTEHYCPLSLLRVYGITEVEQIEDEENPESSSEQESSNQDETSADSNDNIFTTARKAVVDLVSDMAKKLSGNTNAEEDNVKRSKTDKEHEIIALLPENVTHTFIETDFITKCIQRTIMSNFNVSVNPVFDVWFDYVFKKQMCATYNITRQHLFAACVPKKYQQFNTSNIVNSNIPPKRNVSCSSSSKSIANSVSPIAKPPLLGEGGSDQCGHVENNIPTIKKTAEEFIEINKEIAVTHTDRQATTCGKETPSIDMGRYLRPSFTIDVATAIEVVNTQDSTSVELLISDKSVTIEKIAKLNTEQQTADQKTTVVPMEENVTNENLTNSDKSDGVASLNTNDFLDNKAETVKDVTKLLNEQNEDTHISQGNIISSPSVLDTTPTLTEIYSSVVSESENPVEIISSSAASITPQSSTDILHHTDSASQDSMDMSKMDEIQSSSFDPPDTTANTDPSLTSSTIKPVTGLSGSKESIIVKLNAKVKALHANLTMSMMYLEEMSERYRTAVEEVDKRHERKIFALNVSLKVQQDLIAHQASCIYNLTMRVKELSLQMENLTQVTQSQHDKLAEAQVSWIFVEIIAFIVLVLFCRRSHHKEIVSFARVAENGANKETKNPSPGSDLPPKRQPNVAVETVGNGHVYELAATSGTTKKNKRKKSKPILTRTDSMKVTEKRTGILFSAGNRVLHGITDALYGSKEKPSRQADALIDNVSHQNPVHNLRRAKSTGPDAIPETFSSLQNFKYDEKVTSYPTKCDTEFVLSCKSTHKKHRNKLHKPVVGRFS